MPLSLIVFVLFSCDKLDEPDLLRTYTYNPQRCIPDDNQEIACSRSIRLSADGVADILTSGDIMYRIAFKIQGEKIIVAKADGVIDQLVFRHINNSTLKNERDGACGLGDF